MRASHLLAFAAVALILALAGCGGGGGGGGGGGSVSLTTDVTGYVVDESGNGIVGATVVAEVDRTITQESAVTGAGGYYTLQDIPTQTSFTLVVSMTQGGVVVTRQYQNVRLGNANSGGSVPMDVVFTNNVPDPASGGGDPTITIIPTESDVTAGTSPAFSVKLDYGGGVFIEGYNATWTVSGATGQSVNGGATFVVLPGAAGSTFKVRATVLMDLNSGRTVSVEKTVHVVSGGGGGDDDEPPPPPGI